MIVFAKGFMVDGKFIEEGSSVRATTVQSVVVEGSLVSSAKKKIGIQLSGEIETRVFELDNIVSLVDADLFGEDSDEEIEIDEDEVEDEDFE